MLSPVPTLPARCEPRPVAQMRRRVEDFRVSELMTVEPALPGEHLWLQVRKTGISTPAVARRLADLLHLEVRDVGYAGMKDERSVAEQWFSVPWRDGALPTGRLGVDLEILEVVRQTRKLRRGMHEGNRFEILLRDVQGIPALTGDWFFPNYFGSRRFGTDNAGMAVDWLNHRRQRRISRFKQGIYLSVLRALLFNAVLAHRVETGSWSRPLEGEAVDETGLPTGPLWGRGRSPARLAAAQVEREVLSGCAAILEGLEYAGVIQARRSLVARAGDVQISCGKGEEVQLSFVLPVGAYATCALAEWFDITDHASR